MSIIAQQTDITLSNKTKYYLDIKILAEQDEEFRMTAGSHNNVIPISNTRENAQGLFGTIVNSLMDVFTGSKVSNSLRSSHGQTACCRLVVDIYLQGYQ